MRRIISSIVLFVMLFTSIGTTNAFALANDLVNETQNNLEYQQHSVSETVYQDDSSIKAFDYALYSGSSTSGLNINSSKTDITGDVHTNQNFIYRGSTLKVSGTCESVGVVDAKGPKIEINDIKENALFIEMPDIVSDIKEVVIENAEVFNQNKKYNGSNINLDKSIIVNGSVTFNGAKLNTKGYIIAKDNISFNTAKISCENEKGIVICSENGDITINSSNVELNGIMYAPKGTVTINTANFSLKGRIIADRIVIRGSKLNIVSSPEDIDLIYREANIIFSSIEEEYDCSSEHEICFTAVDREGEPVSNVKCTINVTGDAVVATNSIVTDENGKATVLISDNKAEMVTLTATTKKGVSESVDILFRDDPVGKVAPLIAEDIVLDEETGFEVVKNQILVVFNEDTTEETVKQIVNSIGGKIVGYLNGMNDYQIEIPGDNDLDYIKQLITQLNEMEEVEIALLNQIMTSPESIPGEGNDPEWGNDEWDESNPKGKNWGMEAIYAPSAWEYNDQMSEIKIGIIDTALKYDHEDLNIPPENYKYSATGASDEKINKSHATHVMGTIGAISNNDKGVTGIVSNRELYAYAPELLNRPEDMPEDQKHKSQTFEVKYGILWLLSNGCKVINMSMGVRILKEDLVAIYNNEITPDVLKKYVEEPNKYWTPFMKRLINNGFDFVFVQAAGNNNIDAKYSGLMCSIDDEEINERIFIVGNIENKVSLLGLGKHKGFAKYSSSNYGDKVDILAPGTNIFSTYTEYDVFLKETISDTYNYSTGTSMSAPHVAGVAAMVWAVNPDLTGKQVKNIIVGTADRPVTYKNDEKESVFFGNILNAEAAVERAIGEQAEENIPPKTYGILTGRVTDAVDKIGIEDASVIVYKIKGDSNYYAFSSTYEDGSYELYLEPGDYYILIEKDGYISTYAHTNVQEGLTTYNPELKVVDEEHSGQGTVTGVITNALDGRGVEGLTIRFREGINATSGEVIKEATTDSYGIYEVQLVAGSYTGEISGEGFITAYFYVVSIGGLFNNGQNGVISPIIPEGQTRIVLTWGEYPRDLDSHLTGPSVTGRFHVYYGNKTYYQDGEKYVDLDRDDVSSYGPETTTIYNQTEGLYKFYIHDYTNRNNTNSKNLSLSGAEVRVYRGSNLIAVFSVPSDEVGTVWTVFEIEEDRIVPVNSFSNELNLNSIRGLNMLDESRTEDIKLFLNLPEKI